MAKRIALTLMFLSIIAIGCSRETEKVSEQKKGLIGENEAAPTEYFVRLLPESPTVADSLSAEIKIKDEGRFSSKLEFAWEKNNQLIGELNSQRIDGSRFKKGDAIRVKVVPQGGEAKGKAFYSEPVIIQNAVPIVASIKIKPDKSIGKKDTLIAAAEGKDPDGDTISFKYQWLKSGAEEIKGANSNSLSLVSFKRGDFVNVKVTANDGIADGEAVTSGPVAIVNTPPQFTSQPPAEVKGYEYSYKVSAVDADNDALKYSLTKSPQGMTIDSLSGEIKWKITETEEGKRDIEVIVDDGNNGRAVQGYTLTINLPR